MIEDLDFETYLYISKDKFQIFVLNKKKLKNLYSQELKIDHQFDFKDLNILLNFLDKNIYKIEKLIGNFIKNIILIVENEKNLKINMGIKKSYETSLNNLNPSRLPPRGEVGGEDRGGGDAEAQVVGSPAPQRLQGEAGSDTRGEVG